MPWQILRFGTSICVVKFITYTFMCIIDLHTCRIEGDGKCSKAHGSAEGKWMCALERSKATSVTLWRHQAHKRDSYIRAIKMLGKRRKEGVASPMLRNSRKKLDKICLTISCIEHIFQYNSVRRKLRCQ